MKTVGRACLALAIVLFSLAMSGGLADAAPSPFTFPATYAGDTPCADCSAIHKTVTLYADGSYFMRDTYVGRNVTYVTLGTWRYDDPTASLTLLAGQATPEVFHVTDGKTLQMGTSTLALADRVDRFHDTIRWRGSLLASPDFARFTECSTGRTYPISHMLAYDDLMKAYTNAQPAAGAPVLATFDGHIADTPRADGTGTQENIVVEKVDGAGAKDTCATGAQPVMLDSYTWMLTELDGKAVVVPQDAVAPHIVFDASAKRVSGSTGCNNLAGGYERDGDHLKFSPLATTRMMCASGAERETEFLDALARVRSFTISGGTLELFADGALVAKFQAPAAH